MRAGSKRVYERANKETSDIKSTHDPFGITRRVLLTTAATLSILSASALSVLKQARAQTDPLPSWNDGTSKRAIIEFVARVTRQGGPDFVPPDTRIATFDNDGTLWVEHPMYVQLASRSIARKPWRQCTRNGRISSRSRRPLSGI